MSRLRSDSGGVKREALAVDVVVSLAPSWTYRLHGEPMTDGKQLILGRTYSGQQVAVTVRSAGWLDALDATVRAMRATSNGGLPSGPDA